MARRLAGGRRAGTRRGCLVWLSGSAYGGSSGQGGMRCRQVSPLRAVARRLMWQLDATRESQESAGSARDVALPGCEGDVGEGVAGQQRYGGRVVVEDAEGGGAQRCGV